MRHRKCDISFLNRCISLLAALMPALSHQDAMLVVSAHNGHTNQFVEKTDSRTSRLALQDVGSQVRR